MKNIILFSLITVLFSCTSEKIQADLLVKNAKVYTVNSSFETAEAFVVTNGKIIEVGASEALENKYKATKTLDVDGEIVVPGLIDAHAHLYNLGLSLQQVQLYGTKNYKEVLGKVVGFHKEKNSEYLIGRGWDQNDWEDKKYPTKKELDSLFPSIPVALTRIDGHAMIVNSKALELAGITPETKMDGGEVLLENGLPTGLLIDTPMTLVRKTFPKQTTDYKINALKEAEEKCLKLGLTTINDAGLDREIIELIDSLQQSNDLSIRVYAMVSNSEENLDYYLNNGIVKTDKLNVRSVKIYADGALGSRGAAMKKEYSDQHQHFGAMITNEAEMKKLAIRISKTGYQMNTHAIGDSANISVLRVYAEVLKNEKDPRWKVEHSQIVSEHDFDYFSNKILPSIQPTHATSDMYWAEDRVGSERIKGAYAYKTLLNKSGMIALGTDFPIEKVNPMYTFYSAVARKDLQNYPEGGFRIEEALTREETLKGMTIWAAYSNFEENEKGSIEVGKFADFTILDTDIMICEEDEIPNTKVIATYINGGIVYKKR